MKSLQVLTKLIGWRLKFAKVGQGYAKRYVDSRFVVRVIDEKCEVVGRLHQTIHNVTKHRNSMSTTMGGMGQDLHNMGKEMEYYATKLHQVDQRVEVSNVYFLWQFLKTDKDYMLPFGSIRSLQFHA